MMAVEICFDNCHEVWHRDQLDNSSSQRFPAESEGQSRCLHSLSCCAPCAADKPIREVSLGVHYAK